MPTVGMVNPNNSMEKVAPYQVRGQREEIPVATTYTFTGPTSGSNGAASTNFTVSLPANTVSPTLTITPADSGTGTAGVFSPTSLVLTSSQRSGTFKYTPGSTGDKVISVTNSVDRSTALTDPASITYTSS